MADTVLDIIAQEAWNGGRLVDNSIYDNNGLTFKGGIQVNIKMIRDVLFKRQPACLVVLGFAAQRNRRNQQAQWLFRQSAVMIVL